VSPVKGTNKRVCADATKVASPGVNSSNTGQHLRTCKKSKGLGKHGKLEDNQGATELRRPQTPINLFEDECVFCHSFRTCEKVICCISFPYVKLKKDLLKSSYFLLDLKICTFLVSVSWSNGSVSGGKDCVQRRGQPKQ
jgi:BRCA1-associated RING domain protein 1